MMKFASHRQHHVLIALLFLALTNALLEYSSALFAADEEAPVFEKDIQPLFVKKCGKCHSDQVRKGALNLANMKGVMKGGESGESSIAETLDDSMLWLMVDGGGMPPEEEPQLSEAEFKLIRQWIETGAKSAAPVIVEEETINQHDILPIVLLRCTTCHGPRRQDGGLDLRTPLAMKKGGASGPAMIPGDPDNSLMIQRIESEACPPTELLLKFFIKRPPKSEVAKLREWIAAGAPEVDIAPDVATTEPDPLVTDEDRQHWAFQPPRISRPDASIDTYIQEKLHESDLDFSPEADRFTLIRRAYFDLTGLPPNLEELQQWSEFPDENWYAQMIDQLLDSPAYGERWGRYWLDLAGYADSEGGISADPVRPVAWKYRDYVIESFNNDTPYDQFLVEQIAGDELVDYEKASVVTEEIVKNLIATGFLRMGIDQTGSRTMNFVPERLGVIADTIAVLGSGVMGLTLECAKCHSHKYDPIPQRDYYRFKAIFQGALDEHDWLSFKTRTLNIATDEHQQQVKERNPQLTKELRQFENKLKLAIAEEQRTLLRSHYPDQSEEDREKTIAALKIADNNRTLPQRILVEMLQRADVIPESQQPAEVLAARRSIKDIEQSIKDVKRNMVPPVTIRALWDRGEPSPTYLLRRGEHNRPGELVGPGVPSVLTDGQTPFEYGPPFPNGTPKTGRRLAFAQWLTRPEHPLTARVMVNRIWYHHFGTGLVSSLENFGAKGERPSHPELLDWLAVTFADRGWSIKEMHRLIMNSRTYRQSSRVSEAALAIDPTNRLLSRMPMRRMNAEALRDSLLMISGKLDRTAGGPPDPISVDRDGLVSVDSAPSGGWRRSIYVQYRRTEIPTMMHTFDYPEMGPNCISRNVSIVSPQSLLLMHNDHIYELAESFAERVEKQLTEVDAQSTTAQIDSVYRLALSRPPSPHEQVLATQTLAALTDQWNGDAHAALATFCHTIMNSAAYLYVD